MLSVYTLVTRYFCVFANYVCYLKSNGNKYASILGNPDIQDWGVKLLILSYPSFKTFVLGAEKIPLIETVLLSTHNICFG